MTVSPTDADPVEGIRGVWGDYVTLGSGHGASVLLGAATVVLATRLLGPRGYGEVALCLGVVQLAYTVFVHWTMPAIIRFGRDALVRRGEAGPEVGSWLTLVAASVVIAALAMAIWARPLKAWTGLGGDAVGLIVVLFVTIALAKGQEHLQQMAGLIRRYTIGRVAGKIAVAATLGGILYACGPGGGRPTQVLWVMAGGFLLQALTALPAVIARRGRPVVDSLVLRRMVVFAAPLAVRSAATYLLEWMDIFWLRTFREVPEVGIYYSAYQVLIVVAEALGAVATLALPLLTSFRASGRDLVGYTRVVPQLAVMWSLGLGLVGLAAPPLLTAAFGARFDLAGRLVAILVIAASLQAAVYFSLPVLTSHDMTRQASVVLVPMVLTNAVADFLLVPQFGSTGAALATVLTYAVGAAEHAWLLRGALGVSPLPFAISTAAITPAMLVVAARAHPVVVLTVYGIGASLLLLWSRRRVFARKDIALLDNVSLPPLVRGGLRRMYAFLG